MSELRSLARARRTAQTPPEAAPTVMKAPTMMGLLDTVSGAAPDRPMPDAIAIKGGGLPGAYRLAIQVCLRQQNHQMAGAAPNTMKGKAHRLEVTRLVPYGTITDEQNDILRWRIAKQSDDDGLLRPKRRKSLVMFEGGPEGLTTQKAAWGAGYRAVTEALAWAQAKLATMRGTEQLGLLMVVHISDWETKTWMRGDTRMHYDEAHVRAIEYVEITQLVEPTSVEFVDEEDLATDWEES